MTENKKVIIDGLEYIPKTDLSKIKTDKDGQTTYNAMKGIFNFFKFFKTPKSRIIIAQMTLLNGDVQFIPVEINEGAFVWRGKRYLVNSRYLHYNRTFKMYVGFYQEELSLPLNFVIDSLEIKKELNKKNMGDSELTHTEVISNIDPVILETTIKSTVIQKVFAGAQMEDAMRFIKMGIIIIGIGTAIGLFLMLKVSGFINI